MKLVRYKTRETSEEHLGLEWENDVLDILRLSRHLNTSVPHTMDDLLENSTHSINQIDETLDRAENLSVKTNNYLIPASELIYLPLIMRPEKILCVGMNYVEHIKATGGEVPTSPVFFNKFSNTLAAHRQTIPLQANAQHADYEAELVIVIGKEVNNVCEKNAEDAILGYTVGNDLSERAFQFQSSQWLIGKSMDHFAPIGPALVTKNEIKSVQDLTIETRRNGNLVQNSSTSDMLFSVAKIVSEASQYMTLKPGDLIFTGTPRGVILEQPKDKQKWLKAGDQIEISIESLGTLSNTFI
ncbi:2-keto-4-pentenoate hydratase/2-oxohepta-3-ene-1,7-dioic acid hydratase (catechol pathway) [Alkalibacterium subtropicum]|uniref:2-keto-4-pentenoate hydratase/2-oxohepta-3-ene-1,7-dioic acid hydratase (Catechol pathway) n=1 Tax=Alkalibacterium subtropicum TaxID=753702 RepID=A0A1I1IDP0_9LACT|nr:fumarylacetoacetate hydrolase family protein [Alkalibacterium subtropicum]SFC34354.1 2-keto-4-pentenoate hydratase/2-oxohepta-3-ene-1,7-dioic acid hydratase (catechol pathway) [Alkalibacterium subtropicum]